MTTGYDELDVRYLTVKEVCGLLRISRMSVYRFCRNGSLHSIRVGNSFRIPEPAVRAWLASSATVVEQPD